MKKEKALRRQGDILLVPIDKNITMKEKGKAVLALGEVSGHSHRINNALFNKNESGLAQELILESEQELIHEEHDLQLIPSKQMYEIRQQRRVNVLGEIQKVMD